MRKTNQQIERKGNTRTSKRQAGRRRRKATAAKTVRVRVWVDNEFLALIDRGAKLCGTSRPGFVRQTIEDALPKIDAAGR